METIKKERVTKEYYEIYVANDGTEFNDKEECKKYENSALCVLLLKYKDLVVASKTEYEFFGFGSDDNVYDAVKVPDTEAIDIILRLDAMCNPRYYEPNADEIMVKYREQHLEQVSKARSEGDLLFIHRGWEGNQEDFWVNRTRNSHIELLQNIGKEKAE